MHTVRKYNTELQFDNFRSNCQINKILVFYKNVCLKFTWHLDWYHPQVYGIAVLPYLEWVLMKYLIYYDTDVLVKPHHE